MYLQPAVHLQVQVHIVNITMLLDSGVYQRVVCFPRFLQDLLTLIAKNNQNKYGRK